MADDTKVKDWMLTTVDNPFNPFTDFRAWWTFDAQHGYHTPGLLDRVVFLSDELSEADQYQVLQAGIDEIVRENVSGMHRKVSREDFSNE